MSTYKHHPATQTLSPKEISKVNSVSGIAGFHKSFTIALSGIKDIPLLFIRLVLAYGFWGPGMMKWKHIDNTVV
jgi:hypothetical protein